MNKANHPVGGYVTAAAIALFLVLLPFVSVKIALSGDYTAAILMLVLAPVFYYFAKFSVEMNRDARDYRSWLRGNHGWLFSVGVMSRLVYIALIGIAVALDLTVLSTPNTGLWTVLLAGVGMLAIGSMFSVMISSCGNMIMRPGTIIRN